MAENETPPSAPPVTNPNAKPSAKPKPETKAERRALQEAQRAAKQLKKEQDDLARQQAAGGGGVPVPKQAAKPKEAAKEKEKEKDKDRKKEAAPPVAAPGPAPAAPGQTKPQKPGKLAPPPAAAAGVAAAATATPPPAVPDEKKPKKPKSKVDTADIHPAVLRLGLHYQNYTILGGNARCVALLVALKEVIMDYRTPDNKAIQHDIIPYLNKHIQYLINCRKKSISMGNAISFVKHKIVSLTETGIVSEDEVKRTLATFIDIFLYERIQCAARKIAQYAVPKIADGDVILTYARSTAVEIILKEAMRKKKKFSVIVVDSRPLFEGRDLVQRLCAVGIKCTYVLISALSSVMREVTKVLIGAAAVLTNGGVWNRVGTASVCMMARYYHKPVLCCCETYKFTDKTWLNSFTNNEEGDYDTLISTASRRQLCVSEADEPRLVPVGGDGPFAVQNLLYDLTPQHCIAMLITEVGVVPPTSVQVIIREYHLTVSEG